MKLVEILVSGGDAERVSANVAFHLAAGAELVLVAKDRIPAEAAAAVEEHVDAGGALVLEGDLTALARVAVTEHRADWLLVATADEFWWPRGESLTDPLAVMPERYGIVQGLVRNFLSAEGNGPFAERMTMRTTLAGAPVSTNPTAHLRALYRAGSDFALGPRSRSAIPLRAWYPFEVLCFPNDESPSTAASATVEDTRLRDALRDLAATRRLEFRVPDLVDDAAYAVECAAVGEVDLPRLEQAMSELEARIARLEQRFWPRALRRARRLARR